MFRNSSDMDDDDSLRRMFAFVPLGYRLPTKMRCEWCGGSLTDDEINDVVMGVDWDHFYQLETRIPEAIDGLYKSWDAKHTGGACQGKK
jgi:hypothetical protein